MDSWRSWGDGPNAQRFQAGRGPWADGASLATGSVSSHQRTASSGNHGRREGGRKGCVSTCSQTEPARCLAAICLACRDPQALGLPGGWVAGPFGSQYRGDCPSTIYSPHGSSHGQHDCGPASHWPFIVKGANRTKSCRVLLSPSHCAWPEAHTWGVTHWDPRGLSFPPHRGAAGLCLPKAGRGNAEIQARPARLRGCHSGHAQTSQASKTKSGDPWSHDSSPGLTWGLGVRGESLQVRPNQTAMPRLQHRPGP